MKFNVSPSAFSAVFTLPCDVVDKHIKLAGAVQLKVLLTAFRNIATGIDSEEIASSLNIPRADAEDALRYWVGAGLLSNCDEVKITPKKEEEAKPVRISVKPTREEIARRGNESDEIAFILREAQTKFGRALKTSEASTLLWLYDDEGMSPALIFMLLEYASKEQRLNISFIERTAADWIKNSVTDIASAEKRIAEAAKQKLAWRLVENAFGIERRMPSAKELETAYLWVNEWGYSKDMLRAAYEQCVDSTSKFSMPYIRKILEKWHKSGITSPDMIEKKAAASKPDKSNSYAAYDLSEVEKLLDSND